MFSMQLGRLLSEILQTFVCLDKECITCTTQPAGTNILRSRKYTPHSTQQTPPPRSATVSQAQWKMVTVTDQERYSVCWHGYLKSGKSPLSRVLCKHSTWLFSSGANIGTWKKSSSKTCNFFKCCPCCWFQNRNDVLLRFCGLIHHPCFVCLPIFAPMAFCCCKRLCVGLSSFQWVLCCGWVFFKIVFGAALCLHVGIVSRKTKVFWTSLGHCDCCPIVGEVVVSWGPSCSCVNSHCRIYQHRVMAKDIGAMFRCDKSTWNVKSWPHQARIAAILRMHWDFLLLCPHEAWTRASALQCHSPLVKCNNSALPCRGPRTALGVARPSKESQEQVLERLGTPFRGRGGWLHVAAHVRHAQLWWPSNKSTQMLPYM